MVLIKILVGINIILIILTIVFTFAWLSARKKLKHVRQLLKGDVKHKI